MTNYALARPVVYGSKEKVDELVNSFGVPSSKSHSFLTLKLADLVTTYKDDRRVLTKLTVLLEFGYKPSELLHEIIQRNDIEALDFVVNVVESHKEVQRWVFLDSSFVEMSLHACLKKYHIDVGQKIYSRYKEVLADDEPPRLSILAPYFRLLANRYFEEWQRVDVMFQYLKSRYGIIPDSTLASTLLLIYANVNEHAKARECYKYTVMNGKDQQVMMKSALRASDDDTVSDILQHPNFTLDHFLVYTYYEILDLFIRKGKYADAQELFTALFQKHWKSEHDESHARIRRWGQSFNLRLPSED